MNHAQDKKYINQKINKMKNVHPILQQALAPFVQEIFSNKEGSWINCAERMPDGFQDYGNTFWIPGATIARRVDNKTPINEYFGLYGKIWGLENYEWLDKSNIPPAAQELMNL